MTTTFITERLDELEANLPAVPARVVRLQRAIAGAACDQTAAVMTAVATSTRTVLAATRTSGRTVTGQARAAADDVVLSARGGARQVTGQGRAQGRRIAATASRETTQLLDSAIDTVEDDATVGGPGAGTPYEQWTKAQLLERARQLDVEGAYKLNKRQLVKALRSADRQPAPSWAGIVFRLDPCRHPTRIQHSSRSGAVIGVGSRSSVPVARPGNHAAAAELPLGSTCVDRADQVSAVPIDESRRLVGL